MGCTYLGGMMMGRAFSSRKVLFKGKMYTYDEQNRNYGGCRAK